MEKKSVLIIGVFGVLIISFVVLFVLFLPKKQNIIIKFDSNGGSIIHDIKLKENEKINKPTDPIKIGYEFDNWYLNDKEFNFNKPITKSITLVAKWIAKNEATYTITFNTNGGNAVTTQIVAENSLVSEPSIPTKMGYTFVSWQLENKDYDFSAPVTKNITLTATWEEETAIAGTDEKFTITFDTNGGNKIANKTVISGQKVTKPTATKSGYVLVSWQLNGADYNFNTPVTSNITLVATWKEAITYTITFDSSGGSDVKSQIVLEGTKVTKPTNPTRTGYTFISWQLNNKDYNFGTATTSNMTLVATWKVNPVTYTVTFNSDGGTVVSTQNIIAGNKATKPTNPTKKGYTFIAWQLNNIAYDFSTNVTGNITLVANWKQNEVEAIYSYEWISTANPNQFYLYVLKNGEVISGKATLNYADGGGTEEVSIPSSGLLLWKNTIASVSNPKSN